MNEQLFQGTFLDELMQIALTGNFIEPDKVINEKEKVLGDMTPLQKSIYTLSEQKISRLREFKSISEEIIEKLLEAKKGRCIEFVLLQS
jgi:hypothetical protein